MLSTTSESLKVVVVRREQLLTFDSVDGPSQHAFVRHLAHRLHDPFETVHLIGLPESMERPVQDVLAGVANPISDSQGEVLERRDRVRGDRSPAEAVGSGIIIGTHPWRKHVVPVRLVEIGDRAVVEIGRQRDVDLDEAALAVRNPNPSKSKKKKAVARRTSTETPTTTPTMMTLQTLQR